MANLATIIFYIAFTVHFHSLQFTNKCTNINYFYSFISIVVFPKTETSVGEYNDTNKTIIVVYVCAFVGKLNIGYN
jgi:hypothetical protein